MHGLKTRDTAIAAWPPRLNEGQQRDPLVTRFCCIGIARILLHITRNFCR
jgi:hypothetical protein